MPQNLCTMLQRVLDLQTEYSSSNTMAMEKRGVLIRNGLVEVLQPLSGDATVEGKDGIGRKSRVPWVRIFNPSTSPSAREGLYLVYLFAADGSAVHLSLNQGTQVLNGGTLTAQSAEILIGRRMMMRDLLGDQLDGLAETINLFDQGSLAAGYELGHIAGWTYSNGQIPDDETLSRDLRQALVLLREINRSLPVDGQPAVSLGIAADEFVDAVSRSGLVFEGLNRDLPKAAFAAVAAKRFVILTGMSGSGKTQLARALGQWFGHTASGIARYRVVPVRADWTSPEPMLGYEDALAPASDDGRRAWQVPETLRFILDAYADPNHPWLLILDEMNLAHVERYFADVLSGIESGEPVIPNLENVDGYWYPHATGASQIPLPPNLIIIGTVNVDETTYQFSPKVLDRGFSFEFRVNSDELGARRPWPTRAEQATPQALQALLAVMNDPNWHDKHPHPSEGLLISELLQLHGGLSEISLEFGHRSFRESLRFAATLAEAGVVDPDTAWDWIVMTKILPKVHGGRAQLEAFLTKLNADTAENPGGQSPRPLVARKTERMLRSLQTSQFASFAE